MGRCLKENLRGRKREREKETQKERKKKGVWLKVVSSTDDKNTTPFFLISILQYIYMFSLRGKERERERKQTVVKRNEK